MSHCRGRYEIHAFLAGSNRKCDASAAALRPASRYAPVATPFRCRAGPQGAVFANRGSGASQVTLRSTGNRAKSHQSTVQRRTTLTPAAASRVLRRTATPHHARATMNHRGSVRAPRSSHIDIRAQGGGRKLPPSRSGFGPQCCPPPIIISAV